MKRAFDQLQDYIYNGADGSKAIRSWFSMWKYQQACYVLGGESESIQRKRLEEVPERHKVAVYEEARRLYEYRQLNKT